MSSKSRIASCWPRRCKPVNGANLKFWTLVKTCALWRATKFCGPCCRSTPPSSSISTHPTKFDSINDISSSKAASTSDCWSRVLLLTRVKYNTTTKIMMRRIHRMTIEGRRRRKNKVRSSCTREVRLWARLLGCRLDSLWGYPRFSQCCAATIRKPHSWWLTKRAIRCEWS